MPPISYRDFSRGVIRKTAVNNAVMASIAPNSVSHSINFIYDQIVGSGVVRLGTTIVGSAVASNKTPLGLTEFVTAGQSKNYMLSVFTGASTASVYYYDTSWHASALTTLSNTARCRFAMLGNQAFLVNGGAMKSSTDGNTCGTTNCITTDSVQPTLVISTKNRLLAAGDTNSGFSPSRVYFSSLVDPSTSPGGLTWSTNSTTGNWIDINPDDGDDVTAFNQTSGLVLVFKRNSFYRLDVISLSVDLNNVFPFGAVSQEATVNCQGLVYFFTGNSIRATNGGFPNEISRPVQDYISAVSQSNWSKVALGTDGNNVFVSLGTITVGTGQQAITITNCVLKYSARDSTWAVLSYAQLPYFYCQFTDSTNGRKMRSADTSGSVQTVDLGNTDNTTPIYYRLETQEIEAGLRGHQKQITNKVAVYMQDGQGTTFQYKEDDGDWITTRLFLGKRVNVINSFNARCNFLSLAVSGTTSTCQPIFEGVDLEKITDNGMINAST